MKKSILLFVFILNNFYIFLTLENINYLNITVTSYFEKVTPYYENFDYVAKKGIFPLKTNYDDKQNIFAPLDIEEKTKFKATISNDTYENNNINCRLFKYENRENILIFCNLDETIPSGKYFIYFNSVKFNYKEYEIEINIDTEDGKPLQLKKGNENEVELYSYKTIYYIESDKDSIELKFNIIEYNNENLILLSSSSFYDVKLFALNCKIEQKELKCQIQKNKIEKFFNSSELNFSLINNGNNKSTLQKIRLIKLTIIYDIKNKDDVYVGITKLLVNTVYAFNSIAYKTNVTDISNVWTGMNSFGIKFNDIVNHSYSHICGFAKYDNHPLFLVCLVNMYNIKSLSKIEEEIELNNINIKYNFKIQPVINNEIIDFNSSESENYFTFIAPEVLDFTSENSLNISLAKGSYSKDIFKIRFNMDAEDLKCQERFYSHSYNYIEFLNCIVPKSHFDGKENGYFFISRKNHLNGYSICYEIPPVKVILTKENSKKKNNNFSSIVLIIIFTIISVIILALVIFIIMKRNIITSNKIEKADLGNFEPISR